MVIRFTPNSILMFAFRPPFMFQILARLKHAYTSDSDFCKAYERKKNKKKIESLIA